MNIETYYIFAVVFMLGTTATGMIAMASSSPLRFIVPLTVAMSAGLGYFGLDHFLGTPHPIDAAPGWHGPDFGLGGVTVLGGSIQEGVAAYLLVKEESLPYPRLFAFGPEISKKLKKAMETHAKAHDGEKFGFKMKDGGGVPGEGKPGDGNPTAGKGKGTGQSLEDRPNPYTFAEPVQAVEVPKDGQASARELHIGG